MYLFISRASNQQQSSMSHLIMQQNQMMSVQGQVNITLYRRSFNTTYLYYYYYLYYFKGSFIGDAIGVLK